MEQSEPLSVYLTNTLQFHHQFTPKYTHTHKSHPLIAKWPEILQIYNTPWQFAYKKVGPFSGVLWVMFGETVETFLSPQTPL